MARQVRLDRGRLSKAKKTSQGFIRVDGRLTRVGVLDYLRADGTIQRELRSPEEIFKADSLESLEGAPVTDMHPSAMVDSNNAQALGRGFVRSVRRDGNFVAAELVIQAADLIAKIDAGERAEISCGYSCEYLPTPGVWEGQRYDGIQTNVVYNHTAVGPANWGRAGSEVALRLDSADTDAPVLVSRFDADEITADTGKDNHPPKSDKVTQQMTLKINGVEITKLDAAEVKLVQDELDAAMKLASDAEAKLGTLQAAAGASAVELASLKARCDAAEAKVAKVERGELETQVKPVLGAEFKCDGKSDLEIKSAVVTKMLPGLRLDGADAAFVQGAYAAALVQASKSAESLKQASEEAAGAKRVDSNDANDVDKARAEMIATRRGAAFAK